MFQQRGIRQTAAVGDMVGLIGRSAEGRVVFQIILDPVAFSPEMQAQIAQRAERWLDVVDPPLRLVSSQAP